MFCFWFLESYLLDKILFVHNIHAKMLNAQSFQVEASSNKYHLLWGSLISFHMERIHIKLTRLIKGRSIIFFHMMHIQLTSQELKNCTCIIWGTNPNCSTFWYYFLCYINFPSILVCRVSCCSLPVKVWKFSGNVSYNEHVFFMLLKFHETDKRITLKCLHQPSKSSQIQQYENKWRDQPQKLVNIDITSITICSGFENMNLFTTNGKCLPKHY